MLRRRRALVALREGAEREAEELRALLAEVLAGTPVQARVQVFLGREALLHATVLHQHVSLSVPGERRPLRVAETLGHRGSLRRDGGRRGEVAGRLVLEHERHEQVAALHDLRRLVLEQPLGKRREVTGLLHALMLADQDAALSLAARLLGQKKAGRAAVTQAAVHHALGRIHEGRGNHQTARLHLAHAHRLVDTRGLPVQLSGLLDEERGTKSVIDELRSANAALFSMIDSMPDPVFVKDQDHRWVFLNHEFCRLVGQQREALLGKSDYDFFPERQADVFWRMDDMVFQSRTENVNEETITKPSGETYTVTSKKKLFIDHSQEIYLIGTLSFSR